VPSEPEGDRPLVLRAREEAPLLVPVDHGADLVGQRLLQLFVVAREPRHAAGRVRDDQADERRPPVEDVLEREHPSPRVAEEVERLERERVAYGFELVHEPLDAPQRRFVGPVGTPAAELVVEDDLPLVGQLRERLDVVVAEAGPAVQAEQRDTASVAGDPVPDAPAGHVDETLGRRHVRARGRTDTA
jgi:hypothetical protein